MSLANWKRRSETIVQNYFEAYIIELFTGQTGPKEHDFQNDVQSVSVPQKIISSGRAMDEISKTYNPRCRSRWSCSMSLLEALLTKYWWNKWLPPTSECTPRLDLWPRVKQLMVMPFTENNVSFVRWNQLAMALTAAEVNSSAQGSRLNQLCLRSNKSKKQHNQCSSNSWTAWLPNCCRVDDCRSDGRLVRQLHLQPGWPRPAVEVLVPTNATALLNANTIRISGHTWLQWVGF